MKLVSGTKIEDLTDKRFGDIKVNFFIEKRGKHPVWDVTCVCCGKNFTMQSTHLKNKEEGRGCGNGCSVRINDVVHNDDGTSTVDVSTETFTDKFCIVDTEDYFKYMTNNKWYAYRSAHSNIHYVYSKQDNKRVPLHRLVNNTPEHLVTDHINGDGLDNRKINLRSVDKSTNQRNCALSVVNTSGYQGIYQRPSGRWAAVVRRGVNETINLGTFDTAEEAYMVRREAELENNYHENNGRER